MTKFEKKNLFFVYLGNLGLNAYHYWHQTTHLRYPEFKKTLSKFLKELEKLNNVDKKRDGSGGASNSYYVQNHPNNDNHPRPTDDGPEL